MLVGKAMVQARSFEQLPKMVGDALGGLPTPFMVSSGHERALALLFVLLLVGTVGGTLAGVIILLCLALGTVKHSSDRLLAGGMAGGNVEELLGGPQTLVAKLVDQGLVGGPRQEGSDDVGVGNVGQLVALPREVLDVLVESFSRLLSVVFEVPRVFRVRVGTLKVAHEDLL